MKSIFSAIEHVLNQPDPKQAFAQLFEKMHQVFDFSPSSKHMKPELFLELKPVPRLQKVLKERKVA
jgi:hypothetical protein